MRTSLLFIFIVVFAHLSFAQLTPQEAIKKMTRGINLGNTFDPPDGEGTWNNGPAQFYYFDDFKAAGFTSVRIPITWQKHTGNASPYAINAAWFDRIEKIVDYALGLGLIVTIDAHHEDFIKNAYSNKTNQDKFDSIWSQMSRRFSKKSDRLLFEMINEPKGLTLTQINELNQRVLGIIRTYNPTRIVLYSGAEWSSVDELAKASLLNDKYTMGYFHSYDPYPFGLEGTGSYATDNDVTNTKNLLGRASTWATASKVPVVMDECGAIKSCEYNSRMYCYASVIDQSLKHGVAFSAWDDGGNFTIYNRAARTWNDIKDVLIYTYPESPTKLSITQPYGDQVTLKWTNRSTANKDIIIERKNASGVFESMETVTPTTTEYTDKTVTKDQTYCYRLRFNLKDSIYPQSYPIQITTVSKVLSGINDINEESFKIYPNPANENVEIFWPSVNGDIEITVTDVIGRTVMMKTIEKGGSLSSYRLNISNLANGQYILRLKTKDFNQSRHLHIAK